MFRPPDTACGAKIDRSGGSSQSPVPLAKFVAASAAQSHALKTIGKALERARTVIAHVALPITDVAWIVARYDLDADPVYFETHPATSR